MKKIYIILISVAIFGLVAFCFYFFTHFTFLKNASIKTDTIPVVSELSAKVTEIYAQNNSKVKKGQIIAKLDLSEYQKLIDIENQKLEKLKLDLKTLNQKLDTIKPQLKESEENINKAKINLENANGDYVRYKNDYKDGVVTKKDLEHAQKNLEVATKQYKKAQLNLKENSEMYEKSLSKVTSKTSEIEKIVSNIEKERLNLSNTLIIAPNDGIIVNSTLKLNKDIEKNQEIFSIKDDNYYVVAKVDDKNLSKIKTGKQAYILIKAKLYKGKIDTINDDTTLKITLDDENLLNNKKYNSKTKVIVFVK